MLITRFPSVAQAQGARSEIEWPALCAWLTPTDPPPFTPSTEGWSPASFRSDYRSLAHLETVTALAVEHDEGRLTGTTRGDTVSPEQAAAIVRSLSLNAVLVTTKSHTPELPHWRLVIELSRPVTALERGQLFTWIDRQGLNLKCPESKNAACFWYATTSGQHPDAGRGVVLEGQPLDVDRVLEEVGHEEEAAPPPPPSPRPRSSSSSSWSAVDRARAYLSRTPGAVSGNGGHAATLLAAGHLRKGFELSEEDTLALLREWNATCQPPWSDRELRHKASEAANCERVRWGQHLESDTRVPFTPSPSPEGSAMPVPVPAANDAPSAPAVAAPHLYAVPPDADPLHETIKGITAKLLKSSSGSPRKTPANASTIFALDPRWAGVIAYHALGDRVVKLKAPEWHTEDAPAANEPGAWTDADTTRAQSWIAREYGLDLGAETLAAAVWATAERTVIDPLKDYFASLRGTWDGHTRVDYWLSAALGAVDTEYTRAVGRRWLLSAVARALRPGVKVDCVLVLEGPQGVRKSTALATLCPDPGLFFDDDLQIGDKDAAQSLRGKWICELGELSALTRHEIGTLKAFVTRAVDTYRPSFGRVARDFPRRIVFAASTNESEYLKDPTGNRRWWPVRVAVTGPIEIDALRDYRDQLWAEAVTLLEAGAPHYIDTPELAALCRTEQQQREQGDPWEEHVAAYLARRLTDATADHAKPRHPEHSCPCVHCAGVTTSGVLVSAVRVPVEKQDRSQEMRTANVLRHLGWRKAEKQIRQDDGSRVRPYFPPDIEEA